MDAVTALPSFARGMLDDVTRRIGSTVGKGPPFVYPPSWVPTERGHRLALITIKDTDCDAAEEKETCGNRRKRIERKEERGRGEQTE